MNPSTYKGCTQFTIFGERCSGTNYIEELMLANFHIKIVWEYGWKHMWTLPESRIANSDQTLFIGVIRNELDWLNSFKRSPHHIPPSCRIDLGSFLFNPIFSATKDGTILEKPNNNLFELRARKNKFLKETMPKLVDNYILFQYEEISKNYESILSNLQVKFNLQKKNKQFVNITYYKKTVEKAYVPKSISFTYEDIQELAKQRGMKLKVTDKPDGTSVLKLDAVVDHTK
jgi:hypothetical protein